jgi:anti-anti-sigma factor
MVGLGVERLDDVPVARPRGDIDVANANQLRDELSDCLAHGGDSLVLDLSDTRYVDSAGLDMLFRLNERLRERRVQLLLVIPPGSQLARLVEIVALPRAVTVLPSLDEAMRALADGER